jgi:hypothetical protein
MNKKKIIIISSIFNLLLTGFIVTLVLVLSPDGTNDGDQLITYDVIWELAQHEGIIQGNEIEGVFVDSKLFVDFVGVVRLVIEHESKIMGQDPESKFDLSREDVENFRTVYHDLKKKGLLYRHILRFDSDNEKYFIYVDNRFYEKCKEEYFKNSRRVFATINVKRVDIKHGEHNAVFLVADGEVKVTEK